MVWYQRNRDIHIQAQASPARRETHSFIQSRFHLLLLFIFHKNASRHLQLLLPRLVCSQWQDGRSKLSIITAALHGSQLNTHAAINFINRQRKANKAACDCRDPGTKEWSQQSSLLVPAHTLPARRVINWGSSVSRQRPPHSCSPLCLLNSWTDPWSFCSLTEISSAAQFSVFCLNVNISCSLNYDRTVIDLIQFHKDVHLGRT